MDHQIPDISRMIVTYNLVIGILLMLASTRVAMIAGAFGGKRSAMLQRHTGLSVVTFGAVVTCLSAGILLTYFVF